MCDEHGHANDRVHSDLFRLLSDFLLKDPALFEALFLEPGVAVTVFDAIQENARLNELMSSAAASALPPGNEVEEALRKLIAEKVIMSWPKQIAKEIEVNAPGLLDTLALKSHSVFGGLSGEQVGGVLLVFVNLLSRMVLFLSGDRPWFLEEPTNPGWPSDVWEAHFDTVMCLTLGTGLLLGAKQVRKHSCKMKMFDGEAEQAFEAFAAELLEKAVRNLWNVTNRAVREVEKLQLELFAVNREIPKHSTVLSWAWNVVRQAVVGADFATSMKMYCGERNPLLRQGAIAERCWAVLGSLENFPANDFTKERNELQREAALVVIERGRLKSERTAKKSGKDVPDPQPKPTAPLPEAPAGFGWYTQQQVADYVGVTVRTVHNWVTGRTGKLVVQQEVGNQYLLSHAELEKKKEAQAAKKARTGRQEKTSR